MRKKSHVTFLPKKVQLLFITGSLLLALFLAWYISGQNASHAQAAICSEISYKTVRITAKDTLWSIAKSYYGSGASYPKIFDANRNILSDPNKIKPGQILTIP